MKIRTVASMFILAAVFVSGSCLATISGYSRTSIPMGTTISGVFTAFPDTSGDEIVLFGHASSKSREQIQGIKDAKGASDEIWKWNTVTDTKTLFYASADHPGTNQINSATAIVVDESVTPHVYYIADQNTNGTSASSGGVWVAQDGNGDGDINDTGETSLITAEDAIINISGLIRNAAGVLYATNSEGTAGSTMIFRLEDLDSNTFFDASEITPYFLEPGNYYAGGLDFDKIAAGTIYTVDSSGNVYVLTDLNSDGDCLDTGEYSVYATLPLHGGYGLRVDPENEVFVTASEWGVGHALYEITAGTPPTVTEFDNLSTFAGWSGGFTFGIGSSFMPNVAGATLYMNYTTPTWADPTDIVAYQGREPDVPSMSFWGFVVLLAGLTLLITRNPGVFWSKKSSRTAKGL